LHRDIKPTNLLFRNKLDNNMSNLTDLCLVDFGLSMRK